MRRILFDVYVYQLTPIDSESWRRGSNTGFRRKVRLEARSQARSAGQAFGEIVDSERRVFETFELQLY